jgi:UDPglucose--hexose-1-phosphate uridylyltransferase
MELRKDPISQSWVIQEEAEGTLPEFQRCPLSPGHEDLSPQTIYSRTNSNGEWQVRVTPHIWPLYRIEVDGYCRAEGIYDRMRNLGAHEIVVETPDHHTSLSRQCDENMAEVLRAYTSRIVDLKKDRRFRYVTVFRNQGAPAGQEWEHPHSQITATPFIPRRVVYELRSCQRYFDLKERCLLCDIVKQELTQQARTVEWDDQFVAFCPFASRVPYETWLLPINHHCAFEEDVTSWDRQLRFARFLRSILRRLDAVAPAYHLLLHTSPNVRARFQMSGHWQSLTEDFHWHFEILPVTLAKSKSYGLKHVHYNPALPEAAADDLRKDAGRSTRV